MNGMNRANRDEQKKQKQNNNLAIIIL